MTTQNQNPVSQAADQAATAPVHGECKPDTSPVPSLTEATLSVIDKINTAMDERINNLERIKNLVNGLREDFKELGRKLEEREQKKLAEEKSKNESGLG